MEVLLATAFQDLVEVLRFRFPSSILLIGLLLGVVTAWLLRVTKRDNSDAKSLAV